MRRSILLFGLLAALPALPALAAVPGDVEPIRSEVSWPEGPEATVIQQKCLFCHGGEIIQGQRLTPAQWGKEVDKMIKWGSPLTPAEREAVAAYLAKHYGADKPPAPETMIELKPAAPGK